MNLYVLFEFLTESVQSRIELLTDACRKREVTIICIDSANFDYSEIPTLSKKDMLFNIGRGSEVLENLLINDEVITFYKSNPKIISNQIDTTKFSILHDKEKISSPKTIYKITNDKKMLKKYVENLDGFPIILKANGGTLGIGTIKIDNYPTLFSTVDYLYSLKLEFIIRAYVEPKEVCRLIVLGDKVIASNQKFISQNDFRTTIKERLPLPKKYQKEIEELAIKATQIANFEQAGVDIIIDKNDVPYLLEVNSPHDFATTQKATGIDIAGLMVDFLIQKM